VRAVFGCNCCDGMLEITVRGQCGGSNCCDGLLELLCEGSEVGVIAVMVCWS